MFISTLRPTSLQAPPADAGPDQGEDPMKTFIAAATAAVVLATASLGSATPARAGDEGAIAAGIIGGLIVGGVIGQIARDQDADGAPYEARVYNESRVYQAADDGSARVIEQPRYRRSRPGQTWDDDYVRPAPRWEDDSYERRPRHWDEPQRPRYDNTYRAPQYNTYRTPQNNTYRVPQNNYPIRTPVIESDRTPPPNVGRRLSSPQAGCYQQKSTDADGHERNQLICP